VRKLLSLIFLIALAVVVWLGARAFVHRGELKATLVFADPHGIRRGDPVVERGTVIGRVASVDRVDERTAVTIRVSRDHRRDVVTDSLFSIDDGSVVVTNTFAVGRPLDDNALVDVKEDRVSRWLAKHGSAVEPYVGKIRARADQLIDKTPEAKSQAAAEAQKLKEKATKWLKEKSSTPSSTSTEK
jgi:hypothetical protein